MMDQTVRVLLLLVFGYLLATAVETANEDLAALQGFMNGFQNIPHSWVSSDPCDGSWDGIKCTDSRVTSITLTSMNLEGHLGEDIGSLSELENLDLSYNKGLTGSIPEAIGNLKKLSSLYLVGCNFYDSIPDAIGQLQQLVFLSLNSNRFSGRIPPSIGNLPNLNWLDLTDNQLEGPIPVSSGTTPGLDKLYKALHFHLGKNKLSGPIPPQLFNSNLTLIHVLLDNNQLSGSIPSTLRLVKALQVVRFDGNSLSESVPQSLNDLTALQQLILSNNKLSGPLPNLGRMTSLNYLDMSNNSFDRSEFPSWFSDLHSLSTLKMENTTLQGEIPASLFSLKSLWTVILNDNNLTGTLDVGTTRGNQLHFINLQWNSITYFKQQDGVPNVNITLLGNPFCKENGMEAKPFCSLPPPTQPSISDATQPNNCSGICGLLDQTLSPNCQCAYPYQGALLSRLAVNLADNTYYETLKNSLMYSFRSHHLPVDSVSFSNLTKNPSDLLNLRLKVFPSGQDCFNQTALSSVGSLLRNLSFEPGPSGLYPFGPIYFIGDVYAHCEEHTEGSKSPNLAVIIGVAVSGSVLLVLALLAGVYAFKQKKRAEKAIEKTDPFRRWDTNDGSGEVPQLKGARQFSFQELQKYTNDFSQDNEIGSGGYGKVYRGTLPNGQLIAIKRAQKVSLQRGLQFKAEIELLSRVHHKNLVSLLGFCFEAEEQMLVYEYVPNGTLKDTFTGKSGIRLDWRGRLKVALGAARGLAYLHELADPPIIHRDIKSNNILLDERFNAKVADFGLSKPMINSEKDYMTTQVKGTTGYLDPEYYTSGQLTKKSDVYSFGVLMLELITARRPIERGQYVVKLVRKAIDKTKELYGLHELLDHTIGLGSTLTDFEKFVDLAMKCLEESGASRPSMNDVVREIESMLRQAASNLNVESVSTSASFEEAYKGPHHLDISESFDSSPISSNKKNIA